MREYIESQDLTPVYVNCNRMKVEQELMRITRVGLRPRLIQIYTTFRQGLF